MSDGSEPRPVYEVSGQVEEAILQGKKYAQAFLLLDPRLAYINPANDLAVAFDVGRGPEGVAFHELHFEKAIITNSPSPLYQLALSRRAELEQEIYRQVQTHFPSATRFSNLSVSDWLERKSFTPRLMTMLKIAPGYFDDEDEDGSLDFFKELVSFHERLPGKSTIILSEDNTQKSSKGVFVGLDTLLESKGIHHQVFIDEAIPPVLKVLGQRILTMTK